MADLILIQSVVQGALDPEALVIEVGPTTDVPNLSVVTSASLLVVRVDGTEETWTCTITNQTSTILEVTHPYEAGDVDEPGEVLRIYVMASASGWTNPRRTKMCTLEVVAK